MEGHNIIGEFLSFIGLPLMPCTLDHMIREGIEDDDVLNF